MNLNTLAGRSFNDLTQYPVFPWVLADYTSAELDLNNPASFRDLSKPMGALGEARAAQFRERYEGLEDMADMGPEGGMVPFHYGTHFSCAGYVLYYLIRLEPFSHLNATLQGGRFDRADRLFRDVGSSWVSASTENLQDVRELIPEWYSLPDMFVNGNRFDFKETQRGVRVDDVGLPPWAKGDATEFVRKHRQALESKYVSERLHGWIDLIFGFKQRSKEAQNVYVNCTYEGAVDIESIDDPMVKEATLAQTHNFGMTPSRLWVRKPHPVKAVPDPYRIGIGGHGPLPSLGSQLKGTLVGGGGASAAASTAAGADRDDEETPSGSEVVAERPRLHGGGHGHLFLVDSDATKWLEAMAPPLCVVGAPQHVLCDPRPLPGDIHAQATSTPLPISHLGVTADHGGRPTFVHGPRPGGVTDRLYPPRYKKFVRFGATNCGLSFHVHQVTAHHRVKERMVSLHEGLHLLPISCVAITPDGHTIITGSLDSTIRIWHLSKKSRHRALELVATLAGHKSAVTCLEVCSQVGTLVSGGEDRRAVVWDLRTSTFLHELRGHMKPLRTVSINKVTGAVVTLAGPELRLWSANGALLAFTSVTNPPTVAISTHGADWTPAGGWMGGVAVVVGHENGEVSLYSVKARLVEGESEQRRLSGGGGGEGATRRGSEGGANSRTVSQSKLDALGLRFDRRQVGGGGGGGDLGAA